MRLMVTSALKPLCITLSIHQISLMYRKSGLQHASVNLAPASDTEVYTSPNLDHLSSCTSRMHALASRQFLRNHNLRCTEFLQIS